MSSATRIGGRVRDFSRDIWRTRRHQMVNDAGLLAAAQYVTTALGFLTTIVATRLLGPREYGMTALLITYPNFLLAFMSCKPASVATRYIASFHASGRHAELQSICKVSYSVDLLVAVVTLALVSVTGPWVAERFFHIADMGWLVVLYAASLPFFALTQTSRAILSSLQRFRWLAGLYILNEGLRVVAVLSLLVAGFGVPGMVLGTAVEHVASGVVMLSAATYGLHRAGIGPWWRVPFSTVAPLWQELMAFLRWNYLTLTLTGAMAQVPVMLLGSLRSSQEAGFYNLAMSLTTVTSYLEHSLGQVVYPRLSARWSAGERQSLNRTLQRWTLLGGLPTGALTVLPIPLLPIVMPLVFGPAYSPLIPGAQLMLVGVAVRAVFFWLNAFYYASGRISVWTKAYGLHTALVIGLAWWCIQAWGFFGLAGLTALGQVLFTISMVVVFVATRERAR